MTEKPGRPQFTGLQSQTGSKRPCAHRHKIPPHTPHRGISEPVRDECEGGKAAWLVGTLAMQSVHGRTASTTEVMTLSESFLEPLLAGNQTASLASLSP